MNTEDAEEYTQSLGQIVSGSWRQIALAKRLGVPDALGLSVEQWVQYRLGGYIKLSIDERRDAAKQLFQDDGLTQQEIGEVLGVSQMQVSRDLNKGLEPDPVDTASTPSELEQSRKREEALREQLKLAQTPANIPEARYGTIVIDPPWPMKKIEREVRPNQVEFDYPTMDYEQLRTFRSTFDDLCADDCHVFMWTTQKFLPLAIRLFEDYDVKYVLTMVWNKPGGFQPVGLPQYNCEFVLYGRVGSPEFIDTKAFNCCFTAPRREHSRKPDEFYELICRVTPPGRIDIFSRETRAGFEQYGNEIERFSEVA